MALVDLGHNHKLVTTPIQAQNRSLSFFHFSRRFTTKKFQQSGFQLAKLPLLLGTGFVFPGLQRQIWGDSLTDRHGEAPYPQDTG